jgi:hypothetical protein
LKEFSKDIHKKNESHRAMVKRTKQKQFVKQPCDFGKIYVSVLQKSSMTSLAYYVRGGIKKEKYRVCQK